MKKLKNHEFHLKHVFDEATWNIRKSSFSDEFSQFWKIDEKMNFAISRATSILMMDVEKSVEDLKDINNTKITLSTRRNCHQNKVIIIYP